MPNLVPYFSLIMQKLKTTSCSTRHTTARPHTIFLRDIILDLFFGGLHNDRLGTWTFFGLSFSFQVMYREPYVIGKGCWCMDILRRIRYFVQNGTPIIPIKVEHIRQENRHMLPHTSAFLGPKNILIRVLVQPSQLTSCRLPAHINGIK